MKFQLVLTLHLALAAAHGILKDPKPRVPGPAFKAACGEQAFQNLKSDPDGNEQLLIKQFRNQKDFKPDECNFNECLGLKLEDQDLSITQSYTAGQTVQMKVDIKAPHTGVANVSVIELAINKPIGEPLIEFQNYASQRSGTAKNNTAFEITMPDVKAQCGERGKCALQWWWDSREADQTYMSCVDFTMS